MLFFYRFVTVIALSLLGLGIYSTIDQENHLLDQAQAGQGQARKRLNPGPESAHASDAGRPQWLQDDTLVTDTSFVDGQGRLHSVRIQHIWSRDTLLRQAKDPRRVTFYLDQDTLHFLSYAVVEAYQNGSLLFRQTLHRQHYASAVEAAYLDVYMLQHTRVVGYSATQRLYFLEQPLGLPDGLSWSRVWAALDARGQIRQTGHSGPCDGGAQLSPNGQHLLTCTQSWDLAQANPKTLATAQPAVVRWLNDTLYLVVEDMPEGVEPNAALMHRNGERLLAFMYHGYERADFYQSAIVQAGPYVYLMAPQVQELIQLNIEDLSAANVFALSQLKRYRTPQLSQRGACFALPSYEQCCLYLDALHQPVGYTLVLAEQPL